MRPAVLRLFCRSAAVAAAACGGALLLWPALSSALPTGLLPPLHARCVGVMHLALAVSLWSARRRVDAAAARLPLLLLVTWGGASVLAALVAQRAAPGQFWLAGMGLAAAGAAWLRLGDAEVNAPAERAGRAWVILAAVAGALAAALLLTPERAAVYWPWRMAPVQAAAYGAPLLGFAAMAWAAARERRRYVREPAVQAWLTLALGILAESLLHRPLFDLARAATWLWFAAFAAVLAWAVTQQDRWPWHGARRWRY
jgi:hypothetical protein